MTTPPCAADLACVRNDGHAGDHLYPTPDTTPLPVPTPAETGLREAAGRVQDNAVIPDEYEGYYLVRREDYDALVLALRTALPKEEK